MMFSIIRYECFILNLVPQIGGMRGEQVFTSQDCLLSIILRMVSFRAWWTKGVAVAFMYCSINVLARVVALNSVVASSGFSTSRKGYTRAQTQCFA